MNISNKIAQHHVNIWWYHDKQKYSVLKSHAYKLFRLLNYNITTFKLAAKYIVDVYINYDKAVIRTCPDKLQKHYFNRVITANIKIMALIGKSSIFGKLYSWWIIAFSHKKYFLVNYFTTAFYLLFYHIFSFPISKWNIIPSVLNYILSAGFIGHNNKNKRLTYNFLVKYWDLIIKNKISNFVIY